MANEKRLIDANVCPCIKCDRIENCRPGLCEVFAEWWFSSVDAVEVVHGKAVPIYSNIDYEDTLIRMDRQCNQCGALMTQMDNYCPNCGAYMRGSD